jgi:hypothetical protein
MSYEELEDAIVERLQCQGVDVLVLPHTDVLNEARMTEKPRIFVIYQGSDFADREELAVVAQEETLRFELFFRARKRRGHLGVFDLYRHAASRLLGWKPDSGKGDKITFGNFGYVSGIQNNWQYALTFSFDSYIVENPEDPYFQPIKQIINNIEVI